MCVVDEKETSDREREEQEEEVLDSSAELVSVESSSRPATPSSLAHTSKWYVKTNTLL